MMILFHLIPQILIVKWNFIYNFLSHLYFHKNYYEYNDNSINPIPPDFCSPTQVREKPTFFLWYKITEIIIFTPYKK